MKRTAYGISIMATTALLLGACSGDGGGAGDSAAQPSVEQPGASAAAGGEATPDAGGKVIEVQMMTDDQGNNRFEPNEFEAHQGDVVRFILKTGVHNVNFLPDSNAGKSGLPAPSQMLQLPGQTHDMKVTLAEGNYYFQCDPHALLGMIGRMEVEDRDDD